MDTITTDQYVEYAVMEIWSTTLSQYVSAVGTVLVLYDYLLTIQDEIRLVWPGGLNFPKSVYYINRYLTMSSLLFCTYAIVSFRPALSNQFCQAVNIVTAISVVTTIASSTVLLILRLTVLYHDTRWVVRLLWLTFALCQGFRVAYTIYSNPLITRSMVYSPISNTCQVGPDTTYQPSPVVAVPALLDLLLLALAVFKAMTVPASLRANSILHTLIRDEVLFFSIITTLRVANAVIWLTLPPVWSGILIYTEWGFDSVFTARFFINLRAIAHHQRASIFGSHAPSFKTSAVGTRPLRNQPGRILTSNFVHVEIEKTVYCSETSPNDGNIEHPDIIDLEVIDSQAHQQQRRRSQNDSYDGGNTP